MQRELSYQVPFERLARLSRSASRKAFRTVWWLTWLLLAMLLAAAFALIVHGDGLSEWLNRAGIPVGVEFLFFLVGLISFAGALLLRRLRINQVKGRAKFNQIIRLTQDDGGLRFATEDVEHYLKWPGISQLLVEHDGVVVSHGNLFFLVPDAAFASAGERLAFIRDVYGHMSQGARRIEREACPCGAEGW